MIDPRLKASLLARQPLQQLTASAPRTACALTGFLLEYRPQLGVVVSYSVQLLSIPVISFRCMCNIRPAKVHPDHPNGLRPATANGILLLGWVFLYANLDVVGAIFALDQRGGFWVGTSQHPTLVVADG